MMNLLVKLSTTLRDCVPGYNPHAGLRVELASAGTVADLARQIGLPLDQIKIIMVNGRHAKLEQTLQDNDRVAYFPPVGGG